LGLNGVKMIKQIKAWWRLYFDRWKKIDKLIEISEEQIKEMNRIEDSIKFRMSDIENIYPALRGCIVTLNKILEELEEK